MSHPQLTSGNPKHGLTATQVANYEAGILLRLVDRQADGAAPISADDARREWFGGVPTLLSIEWLFVGLVQRGRIKFEFAGGVRRYRLPTADESTKASPWRTSYVPKAQRGGASCDHSAR
jgi:hypothetical protein